ncbi:hypothetical protein AJ80_07244 [Polytolypa hystricis UAMH7299]|uniref:Cell division cycle protein 123 n=1 Tax=Polytolypa hystricis (strain UAMH7299) TaxID=1447883 RepID=A0A2B7XR75_POLH7|nr:hypothetical protein AJ80_07244 [Polytolypa hystricis UAMH7299]
MDLRIVSFQEVEAAISEARKAWTETDNYNTHLNSHEAISAVVPEGPHLKHVKPSFLPGKFSNFASLIMATQGVEDWHVFELPRSLAREVADSYNIWCARGQLSKETMEDLEGLFPKRTMSGILAESVFNKGLDWFLRLDFCSTKDADGGILPVQSISDVVHRLCTSMRGRRALLDFLDEDEIQKPKLFVIPFDKNMNPSREYRVFCPLPEGRVAAISQYRWTCPFVNGDSTGIDESTQRIFEGGLQMHERIMRHAGRLKDSSALGTMRSEGFTFDVLLPTQGEVQLVESNPFGAMSGCGSCLYHWIRDARLLYGLEEKVEVRIAL